MTVTGVSSDVGTIVEVRVETLGDELAAAVAAGATTLVVVDAVDFDEDGGSLAIGTEVLGYTGVDDETGVITLDPATPLVGSYPVEERVELSPASLVKTAQVMVGDFDEAVEAVVPHTLWDRIAEGIRADGSGEVVSLELVDDEFVIADVAGEPVIDGSLLDPSIPLPPELATSGPQGIPGPPGADGQPLYTWLKYADSPTTGMSDLPAGKTYMGLAYNKTTPTESSVYSDYAWSLIQGPQGDTGVEGPAGADGTPRYTWIKYGDSAAGAGLSDSPVGKTYIGIAYNKTTASESAVASDYEWSLIQGPQGAPGAPGAAAATVTLTATSQVLAVPAAGGATTPATSVVTGAALNTTISVWQYSVDGGAFSATVPAGVSRAGNVVTITGSTMTARTIAVRMADANGVADTLTVAKVADGATGATGGTGGTGAAGADAYTVLLTNEAQVFPGSTSAALAGSAVSQVLAYKGTAQQTATIGTITGQVTGLTAVVRGGTNGTTAPIIDVTVTTSLTTKSGTLTIPITVGGVTFTKTFSWSLSLTGAGARTEYSPTAPTGLTVADTGLLWYDTDDRFRPWRWNGTGWDEVRDTLITTKITTFVGPSTSPPSATAVGDLWIVSDLGNLIRRATATGTANWVDFAFSAAAIAALAITVDKLSLGAQDVGMLANGGFEDLDAVTGVPINWTMTGTWALATGTNAIAGARSLQLPTVVSPAAYNEALSGSFSVLAAEDYIVEGYISTTSGTSWTVNPFVEIRWYNSSAALIYGENVALADAAAYLNRAFRTVVTAPSGAVTAKVRCASGQRASGLQVKFDSIRVTVAASLTTARFPTKRIELDAGLAEVQFYPDGIADRLLAGRVWMDTSVPGAGTAGDALWLDSPDANVPVHFDDGIAAGGTIYSGTQAPLKLEPLYGITYPAKGMRYYRGTDGSINTGTATAGAMLQLAIPSRDWDSQIAVGGTAWNDAVNNNKWTVPTGEQGRYAIAVRVTFAANATGHRILLVTKNDATNPSAASTSVVAGDIRSASGAGDSSVCEAQREVYLNAGDVLRVWIGQNSGTNSLPLPYNRFSGSEIVLIRLGD